MIMQRLIRYLIIVTSLGFVYVQAQEENPFLSCTPARGCTPCCPRPLCIRQCPQKALYGKTFLLPRSVGINAARDEVGWHRFLDAYDQCWYGAFNVTPGIAHSYRSKRIAEYFFGTDQLSISGSQIGDRGQCDILADYFGLSPTFASTVQMIPSIRNAFIDMSIYLGYKKWYLWVHAPLVWTRWHFELRESIIDDGIDTPYPALYMSNGALTAPALSFKQAINGGITYGDVVQGIQFGRISPCPLFKFGVADVHWALGYNIISRLRGHIGINVRGVIPTGNRSRGVFLFEPIIGDAHHAQLGIGLSGHVVVWEKDGEQTISIYSIVNGMTLFASRQCRSFDLCKNGFGSRYILLKEFDTSGTYTRRTIPAINQLTLECKTHAMLHVDFVLMAAYSYNQFGFDIGYNAWIRSHEKLSLLQEIPANTFALKGIQNVATPLLTPSNATQSTATIFGNNFADQALVADPTPPVFISTKDIDLHSATASRGFTHKIFAHLQYAWDDCWGAGFIAPFIGLGGEIEFEGIRPLNNLRANKNSVSQWGVWLKGGLAY